MLLRIWKGLDYVQRDTNEYSWLLLCLITPHTQREQGKVIGCVVHIYIYIYVGGRKKKLNRTLEIDSPFQTFAVGLLVEFID